MPPDGIKLVSYRSWSIGASSDGIPKPYKLDATGKKSSWHEISNEPALVHLVAKANQTGDALAVKAFSKKTMSTH